MGRINAQSIEISRLLQKNNFYIPPYQRGYAWKTETAEQLFRDLKNHLETNLESDYFMGNIITYQERTGFSDKLVVVDGQQRITTFMLLITALKVSSFTSPTISEEEFKKIDKEINTLVFENTSRDNPNEKRIKLFSSSREETVNEILNCRIEDKNLDKDKWAKDIYKKYNTTNYYQNLETFIRLMNESMTTYEDYDDFIKLLDRVILVMIDIEDNKGVHEIFENINSKGVDLSLTDLMKNFIYILLESEKVKHIEENKLTKEDFINFNKLIDEKEAEVSMIFEDKVEALTMENDSFITNYLIYLKNEHFNKKNTKEVYAKLKSHIKGMIDNKDKKISEIINEIKQQVSLMTYIENFNSDNSSNKYDLALFLNKNNLTGILFPFVYKMSVIYDSFEDNEFEVNGQFEDFIILMDKFFSRRLITNSSNKNYNKYVPTLLKKIDEIEDYSIENLESILTNSNNNNGSLMPTKTEMLKYFRDNNSPYTTKKSGELKHILFRINYFMTTNSNEGVALTDEQYKKFTIEHVMPQNPDRNSEWIENNRKSFEKLSEHVRTNEYDDDEMNLYNERLHNWGNLTVTQDNSKLSNEDFSTKLEIFESSTLKINQWIANQSEWTLTEIEKRKNELKEVIKEHF